MEIHWDIGVQHDVECAWEILNKCMPVVVGFIADYKKLDNKKEGSAMWPCEGKKLGC